MPQARAARSREPAATDPGPALDQYRTLLHEVGATGRPLRPEEREALADAGEQAAERGHRISEVVGAYLAQTRTVFRSLPAACCQVHTGPGAPARSSVESLLAAVEVTVDALARGHERAQTLVVRREEMLRREFVDDLLSDRSDPERLTEQGERFGLYLAGAHVVAVARGPEAYDDTHPRLRFVHRGLQQGLDCRDGHLKRRLALLATKSRLLVCVVPDGHEDVVEQFGALARQPVPQATSPAAQIAVGRPHHGPDGVVKSYREALRALDLADRLALAAPVLRADELLVLPVLLRDRAAMADLVRTVVGPLAAARGGAGTLLATLDAYFATGGIRAEAARRLHLSVRALTYRLARIAALTGYSLDDPLQRYTLQTATLGARLLDWPAQPL